MSGTARQCYLHGIADDALERQVQRMYTSRALPLFGMPTMSAMPGVASHMLLSLYMRKVQAVFAVPRLPFTAAGTLCPLWPTRTTPHRLLLCPRNRRWPFRRQYIGRSDMGLSTQRSGTGYMFVLPPLLLVHAANSPPPTPVAALGHATLAELICPHCIRQRRFTGGMLQPPQMMMALLSHFVNIPQLFHNGRTFGTFSAHERRLFAPQYNCLSILQ